MYFLKERRVGKDRVERVKEIIRIVGTAVVLGCSLGGRHLRGWAVW